MKPSCKRHENSTEKSNIIFRNIIIFTLLLLTGSGAYITSAEAADEKLRVSGITEALWDVTLSLSVSGTVSNIFFKEGDYVKKGQVILELSKEVEELEVARRKLVWESEAELKSARAQLAILQSQYEASRDLFESTRSLSKEELNKSEMDYKLALAENERLESEEKKQKIEYQMAIENVRKRKLESPINGIINKLYLDAGESCETEQPLVQVVDVSKCRLVCNMEEPIGRDLQKGQAIDLEIQTGNTSVIKKGTIVFVSPIVDPASGLLEVMAEFENQDGFARPGITGFMLIDHK